jgi:hypothetical protein
MSTEIEEEGEWHRNYYGVPAYKGRRVVASGRPGVITGFSGPHIFVRLDGSEFTMPYHPTWQMEYVDETPS